MTMYLIFLADMQLERRLKLVKMPSTEALVCRIPEVFNLYPSCPKVTSYQISNELEGWLSRSWKGSIVHAQQMPHDGQCDLSSLYTSAVSDCVYSIAGDINC